MSGPGTFTFETRQGDDIFSRIEKAVQEQRPSAVAGTKRRPNSPLPSIPNSAGLVEVPNSSSSSSRVVPDPVNISGSGEPIYTDPANVISLSKPILSNVLDPLDSPEIVYAEPMDVIKTPYPVSANQPTSTPPTMSYSKSPEPVYASPVDCVCPRPDPDHCLYADLSEPVYSEVSNDIPDTVEPLHSQQEAVYSEPEEGAYPRTDLPEDAVKSKVTEDQPMDDPSALYSKVNKPPKLSQISQVSKPPKLSQSRHRLPHHGELSLDIVYEDLGFI